MKYPFTVVMVELGGQVITQESWGIDAEDAANEVRSMIRTPLKVVATFAGLHENRFSENSWDVIRDKS